MRCSRLIGLTVVAASACATTGGSVDLAAARPTLYELDGRPVDALAEVSAAEVTAFVFWSASCPCVRRYQARIEELEARFGPRGVHFVAVDSNADASVAEIAEAVRARGVKTRVLLDPGAALADWVGAKTTPTVALFDRRGVRRYLGWVDNERLPGEDGRVAYLEDAIEGLLAGRPFRARSPVFGCPITHSLAGTPAAVPAASPAPEEKSAPHDPSGEACTCSEEKKP